MGGFMPANTIVPIWAWLLGVVIVVTGTIAGVHAARTNQHLEALQQKHDLTQQEALQAKASVSELERLTSNLQLNLDKTTSENFALHQRLDHLTTDRDALKTQVEAEMNKTAEFRDALGTTKAKLASVTQKLAQAEQKLTAKESEIVELRGQLNVAKRQSSRLSEQLTASKSKLERLELQLSDALSATRRTANRVAAIEQQIRILRSDLETTTSERDKLSQEAESLRAELADAAEEIQRLRRLLRGPSGGSEDEDGSRNQNGGDA
jgi:chemotaxis protein MotB